MRNFLDEDFLLNNEPARELYHDYARKMPIIDYHCHLPPGQIAENHRFANLTQIWLYGDHYKWRAMRANGVPETYITGDATDYEKFERWAATVPYTVKNPLYHWTHLELQRYFGIKELLCPATARKIYEECTEKLQSEAFTTQALIRKMNVETLVTTDDPLDQLQEHQQLRSGSFSVKVLPAFRPDRAMQTDNLQELAGYIQQLEACCNRNLDTLNDYLETLKNRHDYFAGMGCRLSDHGIETMYTSGYSPDQMACVYQRIRSQKEISPEEKLQFQSCLLHQFALWDHEKDWVQQFHLGSLRNNNSRALQELGPNTGYDAIGDFNQGRLLMQFLDKLNAGRGLAKTIVYNLNPGDNELFATIIGSFNDGSVPGKMQLGSAWWFLDNKDGIERQLTALANMGLLSRFVGMLTDSRSFLSYPRHEYFRRVLCNLLGRDIENGELPNDISWLGKIVEAICYTNAKEYFQF